MRHLLSRLKNKPLKLPGFFIKFIRSSLSKSNVDNTKYEAIFKHIFSLKGKIYREQKGRKTFSVCRGSKTYFIKTHQGFCLKEMLKNYAQCKRPVLSAFNELKALEALNVYPWVPRVVGYGFEKKNRFGRSFIITRAIDYTCTLEDLGKIWTVLPPALKNKRVMIREIANRAREMHARHIYHQDFYVCHFLWHENDKNNALSVIDWHRAWVLKKPSRRLQIKDLAALYFSVRQISLTLNKQDIYCFIKTYDPVFNASDYAYKKNALKFWRRVQKRGDRLYQKILKKCASL